MLDFIWVDLALSGSSYSNELCYAYRIFRFFEFYIQNCFDLVMPLRSNVLT